MPTTTRTIEDIQRDLEGSRGYSREIHKYLLELVEALIPAHPGLIIVYPFNDEHAPTFHGRPVKCLKELIPVCEGEEGAVLGVYEGGTNLGHLLWLKPA